MHWTETAEDTLTSRQRREDAVAEPCPAQATASSGAVVVVALGGATTEEALEAARDALERASGTGEEVVLAVPSGSEAGDELLTTREAAVALGISVSTARRWSDEGRLKTTKTSGGHRRFRVADLRGLARPRAPGPAAPGRAAARALPATRRGPRRARHAARTATRRSTRAARPAGSLAIRRGRSSSNGFEALAAASRSGRYDGAVAATRVLVARGRAAGATALECSLFLERLGGAMARAVSCHEDGAGEVKEVLRLFVVLRQAALA